MELSHRTKGITAPTIRATDHHVNDNKPHSILIGGNSVEWSLALDRRTIEYGKERDLDVRQLLRSTDFIFIGKSGGVGDGGRGPPQFSLTAFTANGGGRRR